MAATVTSSEARVTCTVSFPVDDSLGYIFRFAAMPSPTNIKVDRLIGGPDTGRFKGQLALIKPAHEALENLKGMAPFACLNRKYRGFLEGQKKFYTEKIVSIFKKIHDGQDGVRFLRELVDTGHYLGALGIYLEASPEAIFNKAGDERAGDERANEGFSRTLLHNAVAPNCPNTISSTFVKKLLEIMLKNGRLEAAMFSRDSYGNTPFLHFNESLDVPLDDQTLEKLKKEHEADKLSYYHERALYKAQQLKIIRQLIDEATPAAAKARLLVSAAAPAPIAPSRVRRFFSALGKHIVNLLRAIAKIICAPMIAIGRAFVRFCE